MKEEEAEKMDDQYPLEPTFLLDVGHLTEDQQTVMTLIHTDVFQENPG